MNAPFAPPAALTFANHDQALRWAKEWHSDCLTALSRAEKVIGSLLHTFSISSAVSDRVKLGQPTRPSFEHLRQLLKADGQHKIDRRKLDSTLNPVDGFLAFRARLAHGELGVWRGQAGQWLLTLLQADGHCAGPICWHAQSFTDADLLRTSLNKEVDAFSWAAEDLIPKLKRYSKA
jgi:hypothetical protein